jgi:WD40 repeat protein
MYNIGNQGKIMRKLLGKQPIDSSTHDTNAHITSSPSASHIYRPTVSQNAVYNAGNPIKCFDASLDGRSVILGGSHILKVIHVDGTNIKDGIDLRSLITAQTATKIGASSSTSDQLAVRDVKWAAGQTNNGNPGIFTACANGKIFHYDLNRAGSSAAGGAGLEIVQIREDARQINCLDINPHQGHLLLSGSQDGIARTFDTRVPTSTRTGLIFRSNAHPFRCNADSVRQVKWSPTDGFYFACSTDQGVVLKWDYRKHTAPLLKIKAHDKICTSIAWHADGEHLVSAGWDAKCHVWDMSKTADKRQKPKWSISTPAAASVVVWRPGQWSASAQGKRAAQLAISYDDSSQKRHGINAVHVWDLARPTLPYKEIQRFDGVPSALHWHDSDLLWTAGQDGLFNQCDIAYVSKVIDRQTMSTMAFSARGDVLMFLDERAEVPRPRGHVVRAETLPRPPVSYSSSPTTPMLSISRSDSEDDIVGTFLGPKRRSSARRRRMSTRSTHGLSTTPPAQMDSAPIPLDKAINLTGIFRSQQAMAFGHVPAAADVEVYGWLSDTYLQVLNQELPYTRGGNSMVERVAIILEKYAKAAESISQFRLAQSWRILAYGMNLLLKRRARYHMEVRTQRLRGPRKSGGYADYNDSTAREGAGTRRTPSTSALDTTRDSRSLLSEEFESTSNVPTPLARPVPDDYHPEHGQGQGHGDRVYTHHGKLTPILEPESFILPPAVIGDRRRLDSVPLSTVSHDSEHTQVSQAETDASLEGYDFYDTEALLSKAIDVPRTNRRDLSRPRDAGGVASPSRRKPPRREDSDDSFSQMFSVSDTSRRNTGLSSSSFPRRPLPTVRQAEETPTDASNAGGAFESRIRGHRLSTESPVRSRLSALHRTLERSDTGLTNFTDEHKMITQTTSDSFVSQEEAIVSQSDDAYGTPSPEKPTYDSRRQDSFTSEEERSPFIIEEDYFYWLDDPPYPHPLEVDQERSSFMNRDPPLQPYTLISRALAFEVKTSALTASAMVLALKPLLPPDVIDSFQASAILRQHHSRLMCMKYFSQAALLRKLCIRGWPGGVLSSWGDDYPALTVPAAENVQVGFSCVKCRKPREVDRTWGCNQSVWTCDRCRAVMAPCAVCGHRDDTPNLAPSHRTSPEYLGLAVKDSKSDDSDEAILLTWWYCPGCGHGGHTTCLRNWHGPLMDMNTGHTGIDTPPEFGDHVSDSSDGCCSFDGCGHACLPGRWRTETATARTEEVVGRAVREVTRSSVTASPKPEPGSMVAGSTSGGDPHHRRAHTVHGGEMAVKGDAHEVLQSRAVESVREALAASRDAGGGGRAGGIAGGLLSSSPGRGGSFAQENRGGERERRKSVKFVASTEGGI